MGSARGLGVNVSGGLSGRCNCGFTRILGTLTGVASPAASAMAESLMGLGGWGWVCGCGWDWDGAWHGGAVTRASSWVALLLLATVGVAGSDACALRSALE